MFSKLKKLLLLIFLRTLAKSTLILIPLFSLYYLAFSVWHPFVKIRVLYLELELVRLYFEIIFASSQVSSLLNLFIIFIIKSKTVLIIIKEKLAVNCVNILPLKTLNLSILSEIREFKIQSKLININRIKKFLPLEL